MVGQLNSNKSIGISCFGKRLFPVFFFICFVVFGLVVKLLINYETLFHQTRPNLNSKYQKDIFNATCITLMLNENYF